MLSQRPRTGSGENLELPGSLKHRWLCNQSLVLYYEPPSCTPEKDWGQKRISERVPPFGGHRHESLSTS